MNEQRHDLVSAVVSPDDYKTELWCSCGEMFWQVNSYHDSQAQNTFLAHKKLMEGRSHTEGAR